MKVHIAQAGKDASQRRNDDMQGVTYTGTQSSAACIACVATTGSAFSSYNVAVSSDPVTCCAACCLIKLHACHDLVTLHYMV